MVQVHAWRGPLAGRRVEIPEADVTAATGPDGWAQKLEPGTVLKTDTSAPHNPAWKIPGSETPAPAATPAAPPARPAGGDDDDERNPRGTRRSK